MIRVDGLTHRYGNRTVLALHSWQVAPGERWLVLGASGSGKTTLAHALTGLIAPSDGTVTVGTTTVTATPAAALDRFRGQTFGIVFQTLRLIASLSVRDNLALAQSLAGQSVDPGRITATLDRLGLGRFAGAKPRDLSTGEAQRAAIARAVVTQPPILVADEPTSALDDHNAEIVAGLLDELAREAGRTLLVITHDQRLKSRFARHLILESQP
jgi:putative ABC transport system ATP-binding protein